MTIKMNFFEDMSEKINQQKKKQPNEFTGKKFNLFRCLKYQTSPYNQQIAHEWNDFRYLRSRIKYRE